MSRLLCWLFGHQWEGTWKRDRVDRDGEAAEWCPRCHRWRSLLDMDVYCGRLPAAPPAAQEGER